MDDFGVGIVEETRFLEQPSQIIKTLMLMPTFPRYSGELPASLNPFNPRHYLLLAYWVFFRPTALNCYVYQAAPNLHQHRGIGNFFRTWGVRAYRRLYWMFVTTSVFLAMLVGVMVACHNLATDLGHSASVNAIAVVSPSQVISGSTANSFKPGTLKLWDLENGAAIHTFKGHRRGINTIAVTPDRQRMVSGGSDAKLIVWDLASGKQLTTLKGHRRWIYDLVMLPDSQRVVSASADGTIKIWNLESRNARFTLEGHTNGVNDLALTEDGKQLISASADRTLKVWDIESAKEVKTLTGHKAGVKKVAILPGNKAISGSLDGNLKVWDLASGKELRTLTGHTDSIEDIAVTEDGQLAISGSADRTLKVWDWQTGQLLHTLTGHQGWVNSVAVTTDGLAVSASSDHTLKVWEIQQGKELNTLKGHSEWVRMVALTPDGKLAVSASGDARPKVWDLQSGDEVPLQLAQQTLSLSSLGFYLATILAIATGLVMVAVILATAMMAFGIAGSLLSILILSLGSTIVFTWMLVAADAVTVNPSFREAFGAIALSKEWITAIFAISLGLLFGVALSLTGRKAIAPLASVALVAIVAVAVGAFEASILNNDQSITRIRLGKGIKMAIKLGWRFNLLVLVGAVRALFYPIEFGWSLLANQQGKGHPVEWDELQIFPLWGTRDYLYRRLQQDEKAGLCLVADVARNPFQRVAAVQALHKYLHETKTPLHLLYIIVTCPELKEYVSTPVSREDWPVLPSTQQLLLGELDRRWVDCSSDWKNRLVERVVWLKLWVFTWVWRDRRTTPLTQFAGMLYELLDPNIIESENFQLVDYQKVYARLSDYAGGTEIADSFQVMAICLSYQELDTLPGVMGLVKPLSGITSENAIRPGVMAAIARLADIGAEVATYQSSTEPMQKLGAIARGITLLDELETELGQDPDLPMTEKLILKRILTQWRPLLTQATSHIISS